jgi:hypothetical protein
VAAAPGVAAAATQTFTSSGTFTVPDGVTSVRVDAVGAGGGENDDEPIGSIGGPGGEAAGTVVVTPGEALSVLVGGKGAPSDGGNGGSGGAGGGGGGGTVGGSSGGGGGGGRSEVDRGSTRLLVAGGGGGASFGQGGSSDGGGAGGGLTGLPAPTGFPQLLSGGSQTQAGVGGQGDGGTGSSAQGDQGGNGAGGDEVILGGGGGGGGFFGGGGGGSSMSGNPESYQGGAGGSGHLDPSVTGGVMTTGVNSRGGLVSITYADTASSTSTPAAGSGSGAGSGGASGTPPAAAPPLIAVPPEQSNAFTFAQVRVGVHQLRIGFDYPGRGTLDVLVTTRRPGASSARLRPGGRRVGVGRLHDSAGGPETHTLRVPLTDRGQSILARRGKLPIRLSLVFTPEGGQSARLARKYTVRPA